MFLKRVGNIFCVRAPSNNVAVFTQVQDRKADTFRHNVSATMSPRLARALVILQLVSFSELRRQKSHVLCSLLNVPKVYE